MNEAMATNSRLRLNSAQIAAYRDEGYLLYPEPIFPLNEFTDLVRHFEAKLEALPASMRPETMDVPHFDDPTLFRWLLAGEVLDLVEGLVGPDITLFSSHFICKPKGDGRRVPWHEDSAYWKKLITEFDSLVTVWLAIDPSTLANGCMQVIPRTHRTGRKGFSDYEAVDAATNVFASEIVERQRDASRAVPCILRPNHASLHDSRTMHGSAPNTSALRRCGWTMRFMPSSVRLTPLASEFHQVYLARGRDLTGGAQAYADPTRAYPETIQARQARGHRSH